MERLAAILDRHHAVGVPERKIVERGVHEVPRFQGA
jgi:hypothetical protein